MIGMNGDRYRYTQFVAGGIDLSGNVPIVDSAVSVCPAFGLGDLNDYGRTGFLGSAEGPFDYEGIPTVGRYGNGFRF